MSNILILVTNHATLGSTGEANGTFAPELTHALDVFQSAGFDYDIASLQGGRAPLYGTDLENDPVNQRLLDDSTVQAKLTHTLKAAELNISDYDGIFYPGGFGLLSDLAESDLTGGLTAKLYEADGVVGAVCHGPAGLLPVTLSNGEKLLADKAVTGFTREEEIDHATIEKIPFLLEEHLARTAKSYSKVQPWGEHVVVDGRLVTGQNPASAHGVGSAMVKLLAK